MFDKGCSHFYKSFLLISREYGEEDQDGLEIKPPPVPVKKKDKHKHKRKDDKKKEKSKTKHREEDKDRHRDARGRDREFQRDHRDDRLRGYNCSFFLTL